MKHASSWQCYVLSHILCGSDVLGEYIQIWIVAVGFTCSQGIHDCWHDKACNTLSWRVELTQKCVE